MCLSPQHPRHMNQTVSTNIFDRLMDDVTNFGSIAVCCIVSLCLFVLAFWPMSA
jgi:hypothetical protein